MFSPMDPTPGDNLPAYRLPEEAGASAPLPPGLDTADRWRRRARLVRPDAEAVGELALAGEWVAVYPRTATVPIESDADLDATSAAPRRSRVYGVYDYGNGAGDGS